MEKETSKDQEQVIEGEGGQELNEEFPLEALTSAYLVRWFIATLSAKAWEALGLVANPLTQEIKVDLGEARTAIDAVAALVPVIEGSMDPEEASRMKALLRDLRVNFVEKSKESQE